MLAFTFPGQGSQRPGMGRPWQDHESWELVEEADDIGGRGVARLLLDADADELKDTRNAQLTTFVSSLMVLDAVERLGIESSYCAGHSLGEYTALTATGALAFDEGVQARHRARPTRCTTPAPSTRARWPPSSASTTTRSTSPAVAPIRRSGWPTTTRPARW